MADVRVLVCPGLDSLISQTLGLGSPGFWAPRNSSHGCKSRANRDMV
jgi:hypothetical protein